MNPVLPDSTQHIYNFGNGNKRKEGANKNIWRRITAIILFLLLIAGAGFCLQRLHQDVATGKYFRNSREAQYDIVFIASYILIILFVLRYGYYLAVNRVDWRTIKDDFFYLLNKKHFSRLQWLLNILLFWLALIGFIYSLAISIMQGTL